MRRWMVAALAPQPVHESVERRPVGEDDAEGLARLMLAAYRGTVDDEGETIEDARREIGRLYAGEYGELLPDCCTIVEREAHLASATLVTLLESVPLVAFSMTDPRWARRGLARAGLCHGMNALRRHGHDRLRLVVTRGNTPAERLYESLGFRDE